MSGDLATCIFCERVRSDPVLVRNELAVAFGDAYPVNPGHILVVPRRHVLDYFALTETEQAAVWQLVNQVRHVIDVEFRPDGYNIGVNVGAAAGQTVGHVHVHVIPRFKDDVADPRGGVRWVVPSRACYWAS